MSKRYRCGDAVLPLETAVMTRITGAAALHTVLMRIMYAQDEHEVLGHDNGLFEMEHVQLLFESAFEVLRRENVMRVQPLLMPIAREALQRVRWACNTIFRTLDMICRTLTMGIARAKWHVAGAIDADASD